MHAVVLQVVCVLVIIAAVAFFVRGSREGYGEAKAWQIALAGFQLVLCGWFFALCVSDFLDVEVNFSLERLVVDVFYLIAFLAIYIYVLFFDRRRESVHLKVVVWAYLALIVVQCFVFPYGTEGRLLQVFEDVEGAVVVGLLVAFMLRMDDAPFGQVCLIAVVALELVVAVENVAIPFSTIVGDFQAVDIPLNYAALFMRPVLFGSLALAYRVWLDHRRAAGGKRPLR